LKRQANELTVTLDILRAIHGERAGTWSWVQIILTFLTAALAGITAAGVIASVGTVATILAILAALSSATSVAIKPDERREKHRTAADGFGVLHDEVARFNGREVNVESIDETHLEQLWDSLTKLQTRFHEIGKQTINVARTLRAERKRRNTSTQRA
jgi:hypothetical protein